MWSETAGIIAFGQFQLDCKRRQLTADGHEIILQPRAFDLLQLFVSSGGQVLSTDELVGHVWRGIAVGDNNLAVQLSTLRRVLAEHGGKGLIVTVPGRGYRFVGDVVQTSEARISRAPEPSETQRQPIGWRVGLLGAATLLLVIYLALTQRRAGPPASQTAGAAQLKPFDPPLHSVAILAFANLSNDSTQDYLSDGLSEAVIDALSRVSQMQVTARTSSFYFKNHPATIDEIARRLNVGSVLEGSLRRQGNRLRIDTHLSDARTGYQIWSQSYDLQLADMLKLQDEIAAAVADALKARLLNPDAGSPRLAGTANPQAFDTYLRAKHLMLAGYDQSIEKSLRNNEAAIAEFRKAVKLDPDFALALTDLSSAIVWKEGYAMSTANPDYQKMMAEARHAAEHAISVAPDLGLPHAALGNVIRIGVTDLGAAWAEAVRAKALTPGDVTVEETYAQIAMEVGHREEAIEAAARAVELDPLQAESWFTSMRVFTCARKFDAAREALQRGITLIGHPTSFSPYIAGTLFLKQGKADAARQACETDSSWTDICLAVAYHALGRQKDAEENAKKMYADAGDDNSYNLAIIYAQWSQPEVAMKWLRKARQINDPGLADLECDAWLDPIRDQPGFREIERSLHLPSRD